MTKPKLNPRLNPFRDDLAAAHLEGQVDAKRFVTGQPYFIKSPMTGLYRSADESALDTQAQMGEGFLVYDLHGDWSWGQLVEDSYVGWIKNENLQSGNLVATHKVGVLRTIVFSEPNLKTLPMYMLSLNSKMKIVDRNGDFSQLSSGGWVYSDHLFRVGEFYDDYVSVAEMFQDAPYLWGGKDSLGLDCSGLVQSSMKAAGFSVPRDAGMQEDAVGVTIPLQQGLETLQRGDLVFWAGHVGIMQDDENLLHANAHHMMCASEPVSEVIERIAQKETAVRSIKRPSALFQP